MRFLVTVLIMKGQSLIFILYELSNGKNKNLLCKQFYFSAKPGLIEYSTFLEVLFHNI